MKFTQITKINQNKFLHQIKINNYKLLCVNEYIINGKTNLKTC